MKNRLLFVTVLCSCIYVQAQDLYKMGLLEDDGQYELLACKADLQKRDYSQIPQSHSLKAYCPKVMSQRWYSTCVGWAAAYSARSIAEAVKWEWRDKTRINNESFSPLFVYALIKNSSDDNCAYGSLIEKALEVMKEVGSVKFSSFNTLCANHISESLKRQAAQYKIDDYFTLFNTSSSKNISKTEKVKKALSEDNPVIIGMRTPVSFHRAGRVWTGGGDGIGCHAMCVVGYDDNESGGAFQIMNSWGADWADNGFTWIKYSDFEKYVYQAYELYVKKFDFADYFGYQSPGSRTNNHSSSRQTVSNRTRDYLSGGASFQLLSTETPIKPVYNQAQGSYNLPSGLQPNDRYQLNLSNNGSTYVYVIGMDTRNNVRRLFPETDRISALLNYKNSHLIIPSENSSITLSTYNRICILYSKIPLDFDSLISKISSLNGTFPQKVKTAISERSGTINDVQFQQNQISFSADTGKDIVPVFVDL